MFNVFEYEKRQKSLKKQRHAESKNRKLIIDKKAKNEELGEAYRQRVGKFIKKLMVEPVYVTDEVADRNNDAIEYANKSIDASFYNQPRSNKHMRFNSILVAS